MLPALTVIADILGIFGGFLLSTTVLEIHPVNYFQQTLKALLVKDILTGLIKAWAFGIVITIVGAYQGFKVEGGAEEVGRRTTASVVASIFLVIVFDLFFTALFYYFT
jgi:phospholipid/cholesterol/gamma-HCH transport system permease protein